MKEYRRQTPQFSLCGLNCSFCPRYHTVGSSRCPGCGGEDFYLKHPSCGIISCSQRHGGVEYCFDCDAFPCRRYQTEFPKDSFITYRNVLRDLNEAKMKGMDGYLEVLQKKEKILEQLLSHFDAGRQKGFYCLAVNLLPVETLEDVLAAFFQEAIPNIPEDTEKKKKRGEQMTEALRRKAAALNIELVLRK